MDKIRKIIIFMIIILVIFSLIVLIAIKRINKENNVNTVNENETLPIEETSIGAVKEINQFYTVEICMKKYISYTNLDVKTRYNELNQPSLAATYNINTEDEKKQAIINLLDKDFIDDKGISVKNLSENIDYSAEDMDFEAIKINKLEDKKASVEGYAVYGKLKNLSTNNQDIKYRYYIVKIDKNNNTFCIYPVNNEKYKNIDEITVKNNTEEIAKNTINTFIYSDINESEMATKYFENYKENMLDNYEYAYELLDKKYREKRFGSIEGYKKYIDENIKVLKGINIRNYLVNNYGDYKEYVCKDQHDNVYIFKETAIMQYTCMLDTYTIPTTKFKETYNSSDDQYKIQMNIDKFFQMINRQDYKTSYSCLAESYKNNYFKTEEEFAEYVKENFFTYNKVSYEKCEQKGSGLYVFEIELSDLTEENTDTKKVTIIMQLNDNLDFEMSFSM